MARQARLGQAGRGGAWPGQGKAGKAMKGANTMHKYLAWHFVGKTLRDGRAVPKDGVKLIYDGPVVPCKSGLHASRHPFDALRYAPGPVLCLVECGGIVVPHGNPEDKIACSERTIIARMNATPMLRYFARQQALSVLHLYPGDPDPRVLDWLMGDDAARSAARSAAWSAAWSAAESAAESAAWSAAWSVAWSAAESAAESAAWSAARSAAESAAESAAWSAAWSAAESAAESAARSAAWSAARSAFAALAYEVFEYWP